MVRTTSLLALVCALAPAARAGAEPFVAKGRFSIEPPPGWNKVDPEIIRAQARERVKGTKLASVLDGAAPLAMFMTDQPTNGYRNNLTVRESSHVIAATEENLAEGRRELEKGAGPLAIKVTGGELVSASGGKRAMKLSGEITVGAIPVKVVQVLYPGRGGTFIALYSYFGGSSSLEEEAISNSWQSFRNLEPWYRWFSGHPIGLAGAIGGGVGALVVFLTVLRRRRARTA